MYGAIKGGARPAALTQTPDINITPIIILLSARRTAAGGSGSSSSSSVQQLEFSQVDKAEMGRLQSYFATCKIKVDKGGNDVGRGRAASSHHQQYPPLPLTLLP